MKAPLSIRSAGHKIKFSLPTSWDDVTLREFYDFTKWAIKEPKDMVELYAMMSGIDYETLCNVSEQSAVTTFDVCLQFLYDGKLDITKLPVPETVQIMNGIHKKDIEVPKELVFKQLAQRLIVNQQIDKITNLEEFDPIGWQRERAVICIYVMLWQELTGLDKFDLDKAMKFEEAILNMPCTQAIPLAVFFWNRLNGSTSNGVKSLQKKPAWMKLLQILINWSGRGIWRP